MPPRQPFETWGLQDDWTGVEESKERRKRQNRLNQRAYRKRKHLERFATVVFSQSPSTKVRSDAPSETDGNTLAFPERRTEPREYADFGWIATLNSSSKPKAIEFKQMLYQDHSLKLQAPSDLPTLARLNVLYALAANAKTLSISFVDLELDESISPFNLLGPNTPPDLLLNRSLLPPPPPDNSLHPTALQKTVVHHPWVDVFPAPGIRDNILRGLDAAEIDEDELCGALLTIESDVDDIPAPLVVWGDPGDAWNWEISPEFMRKWGVLLKGCPEVLQATNFWRRKRGRREAEFVFGEDGNLLECSVTER
ncbi:hypothetical protein DIS24_g9750 [Lasiodiplodia hormozganensis]|uniref:BZIP domain-containing protein n=1 Tax=Lasiodiplodia hormozganensis TaxID=869390 RepID=A0AA40CIT7_9PEZI|nr:hypothetical protein DIS24_g9750 [Lasiodiplodia hormozganensis]